MTKIWLLGALLAACGGSSAPQANTTPDPTQTEPSAWGSEEYGGDVYGGLGATGYGGDPGGEGLGTPDGE